MYVILIKEVMVSSATLAFVIVKHWNITDSDVDKFYVAWRKVKCYIWKIPNTAHNRIIHNIASNIHIILKKRLINVYTLL